MAESRRNTHDSPESAPLASRISMVVTPLLLLVLAEGSISAEANRIGSSRNRRSVLMWLALALFASTSRRFFLISEV